MSWFIVLLLASTTVSHHHHHHHHHIANHGQNHGSLPQTLSPSISYGPSIISLTKYNRDVHGPTIFHPDTGRTINLEDYPNYSVVVPLASDSPTATSNQIFIARRLSGPGEFHVTAPPGHGVMAVVQSMDFRTAPSGCNDFIQFGEIESGVETAGTCGKVDNHDGSFAPLSLVGPRVFLSPSGTMKVLFYHGYIWGLVRDFNFDILDPSRNAVLRVEIAFTAYKECDASTSLDPRPIYNYRPCTNNQGSRTCIPAKLFCDRVTNCAFEENFGSDEYISNCLPTLFNLLLPRVRPHFLTAWRPSTLSSVANASYTDATLITTAVPTTTPVPTATALPTTTKVPTTSAVPRTTPFSTTTAVPKTTTTPTTTPFPTTSSSPTIITTPPTPTTPEGYIELSSSSDTQPMAGILFSTQLHDHLFDISPEIVQHRTTPSPTSTSTSATTTIEPTTTLPPTLEVVTTVILPPEFEEVVNYQDSIVSNISSRSSFDNPHLSSPQPNMTFTGNNNALSVDEDEGQVEQLNADMDDTENNYHNKDTPLSNPGLSADHMSLNTLWIVFAILILLAAAIMFRLYCCRNRVIWVPNPKMLRRANRKRRATSSLYANNANHNYPETHSTITLKNGKGSTKSLKETTPPSYDILFPKTSLHDADVLP